MAQTHVTRQNASVSSITANSDLNWMSFKSSESCTVDSVSIPVRIVDVPTAAPQSSQTLQVSDTQSLAKHLEDPLHQNYKCRLISICQLKSWSKLQVTKNMIQKIVEFHNIDSGFLELPLSFGYRNTDEEEGFCVPWSMIETGSVKEIFYTYRYAQFKNDPIEPWVIRQTGIYHQFNSLTKQNLWILINPMESSLAEQRLISCLNNHQTEIDQNPLWLHSVIHTSYFANWRRYLAAWEKILLPIADTTTATFITETLRVNHETLGKLRSIESHFLPIKAIMENFIDVLAELQTLTTEFRATQIITAAEERSSARRLQNQRRQADAYSRTSQFLQRRSNNTATLLADTLAFKNQSVAQEQNISMLRLTRSAIFITVLTLLYLPWTFVTGLFGMDFFNFDTQTHRLQVSSQIWIYFVTSLILTIVTASCYLSIAGWGWRAGDKAKKVEAEIPMMNLQRGWTGPEGKV